MPSLTEALAEAVSHKNTKDPVFLSAHAHTHTHTNTLIRTRTLIHMPDLNTLSDTHRLGQIKRYTV